MNNQNKGYENSQNLKKPDIENRPGNSNNNQGKDEVTIRVNDIERKIHRGNQTVEEIKKVGEVPIAYELDQLLDGLLVPLQDSGSVVIRGNEQFFGHVRDGSSA